MMHYFYCIRTKSVLIKFRQCLLLTYTPLADAEVKPMEFSKSMTPKKLCAYLLENQMPEVDCLKMKGKTLMLVLGF